jgi:hypothetical protein
VKLDEAVAGLERGEGVVPERRVRTASPDHLAKLLIGSDGDGLWREDFPRIQDSLWVKNFLNLSL